MPPSTLVPWFFLHPIYARIRAIFFEDLLELSEGEWRKLFDADNGDLRLKREGLPLLDEVIVYLPRAKDDSFDGGEVLRLKRFAKDGLEAGRGSEL